MMRTALLALTALALAAAGASAHHSFGATYEVNKQIRLEGKLVQFVYRNPHSFVHIEAPDESGAMQRWAVEWGGTAQLTDQGVKRDTLKVGDHVIVVGRPSRVPGEYRVLMVQLTRPSDGFTWGRRANEVVD
jgi:DNA/RNA endonuclease YhcR with UshA esterase domain